MRKWTTIDLHSSNASLNISRSENFVGRERPWSTRAVHRPVGGHLAATEAGGAAVARVEKATGAAW